MTNDSKANKIVNKISSNARTNILAKLKAQVSGSDYSKLPKEIPYDYPQLTHQEHIEQFVAHLEANHAQVIKTKDSDIAKIIKRQLEQRNLNSLLCGKKHITSELISPLKADINLQAYDFTIDSNKEMLFNDCPAALSNSRCAISATGSIVLWPDSDEPRSLSLVPPVHFVIVDAEKMYADFATLMAEQQWHDKLPTNVVLISGPSKTADIQQTLAYGAHGPKELIVLLLNG
ncbi:MAG: lactate utilization protein [Psychromonas sp.]|nr:lactate utilization protein [Psychromonas sp.]